MSDVRSEFETWMHYIKNPDVNLHTLLFFGTERDGSAMIVRVSGLEWSGER